MISFAESLTPALNARPPQPRYVVTWDVDKVLRILPSQTNA